MSPPPSTGNAGSNSLSCLAKATDALKRGDTEEAMCQLKSILDTDPSHELANGILGSIYANLGLVDRAVQAFRQALGTNPQNPLARFQMGVVLLTAQRYQEAVDALAPMLALEDEFLAHFHSALALIALDRPAQARPLLLQANQRMPASHPLCEKLQQLLTATE